MADVTARNAAIDAIIETAIASVLSTFASNKTFDIAPVADRTAALRYLTQRILKKTAANRTR